MLTVVDEEGVALVVLDDVINAGETQCTHHILPVGGRVYVKVLAAVCERNEETLATKFSDLLCWIVL